MEVPKQDNSLPALGPSPIAKSKSRRSLSDGGSTPIKIPSLPNFGDLSRRTSKDDSGLRDITTPVTPRRPEFPPSGLSLQMPTREFTPPPATSSAYIKAAPLSPQVDNSHIYASPTNIVPRRSRGLDFSRSATSLHHSTLAGQSSPDASPTMAGKAMNIPARRGDFGGPEQVSTSLWSMMGNRERMNLSHSLGSAQAVGSDSSSSSDEDDPMDEDMEDNFVMTPQVHRTISSVGQPPFGSPAAGSLMSFQQRQRHRKHIKKKARVPMGIGFNSGGSSISNSPPNNAATNARRESISWQANQLHIADAADETNKGNEGDGTSSDGSRNVIRRAVTRRGNMLPKTKTFARIRAVLAEEGAPAEAEFKREAEVVKQVRESDVLEPRRAPPGPAAENPTSTTAPGLSSPNQENLDDIPEDDMMGDLALGLSSSFKQQAMKNSKGKNFWDTFSDSGSVNGGRTSPPPLALQILPRGSSSNIYDDMTMDSPSLAVAPGFAQIRQEMQFPQNQPPSAAEITRRINNKRRRDSDFDPVSFKRRAVSPGMSVHNSPLVQSPMQRDAGHLHSRPSSNSGEKNGSSAPSESGSNGGASANATSGARVNGKGRVGFQGMVDTNEGIMRMSIE
ncbi:unnamed protein product [Clonostachys solani]|uniref:Uncharacterized protein n=1 Tax=Clonostachys solani TaxID=160281 RepID=A0A9N9ZC86_9HYPO|nr:unnamed protein product [Clonostachys solani]